ncbi:hypothetical protein C900_01443 [Fulvivirga imtechensis AK7]|uniref:Uncharacterized protein n=1 Tax=Fulvivirga imtechensis AK7 TaxID=1237149 RepID=L8K0B7_9BACT|nr:hypothetical protein [Fulvivirga imtechensis]ELR73833.1 hypothetical protein C900_01443 [Fulvivirga imtechensis AK7]
MNIFKNIFSSKKATTKSNKVYFKTLNYNVLEGQIDPSRLESLQEYDGEYNYELSNKYFENALFYSESDKNLIRFQIFFTKHAHFRYPEFYRDSQEIQDHYKNQYETPFFFSLSNDQLKKKYHPTFQLGEFLNLKDFKDIILPNLKFDFINEIKPNVLDKNGYYVFYNWDFFEETQISPYSNSFLRYIDFLPYNSRTNKYNSKEHAKIGAFNALLENACSTADTRLKGLKFKLRNPKLNTLTMDDHLQIATPSIRSLNELESGIIEREIDDSLKEIERQGMKPFEIIKNS